MMREKIVTSEIKKSLNQAVDQLPPPSFEKIASMPVVKMDAMDSITTQERPKSVWLQELFRPVLVRRMAVVCSCCLVLLFVGAGGLYSYNNVIVDSVVDIDVNPAFELKINRKDKVLTFSPLNEDAVQAAQGLSYKGWDVEDAVKDLRRNMEEKEYLTDEKRTVLISVENKDPEKVSRLQSLLSECFRTSETERTNPVRVVTQERKKDKAASQAAKDYHISAGKLQFIRTMTASYPDLDENALAQMTMEELYQIIHEREDKKPEWLQMDDDDWEDYMDDLEDDDGLDDDQDDDDSEDDGIEGDDGPERDDGSDDDDSEDDDDLEDNGSEDDDPDNGSEDDDRDKGGDEDSDDDSDEEEDDRKENSDEKDDDRDDKDRDTDDRENRPSDEDSDKERDDSDRGGQDSDDKDDQETLDSDDNDDQEAPDPNDSDDNDDSDTDSNDSDENDSDDDGDDTDDD